MFIFLFSAVCQAGTEPVLVGGTISRDGPYRETSEMIEKGYRLWEKEVNDRGGILGRPVKLILYNDHSDPAVTTELYRKLVEEDHVELVVSPYGTPLTIAATDITEKHKLVMLACSSAGRETWERGQHYIMGMYALGIRYQIGFLDLMAREGFRTLSVLVDEGASFHLDVLEGTLEWADRLNIQVRYVGRFSSGGTPLEETVKEVMRINSDGLVIAAYTPDCYAVLRQFTAAGYRPRLISMAIAPIHPDFMKKAGAVGDRVFAPSQWEPDERIPFPGTTRFIEAFRSAYGTMPSYHAGSAYASGQLLEEAADYVGSLDNTAMRDYIASLDTVTIIGRFKVDRDGRQIGHNSFLIQWQNGKKEIVWPLKMQTARPLY